MSQRACWGPLQGDAQRLAAMDAEHSWTRGQLQQQAQQVAELLRGAGLVALWLEPGVRALAAMLGALQAGVPYLPLDTRGPGALLEACLEDAGADALLYEASAPPPHWTESPRSTEGGWGLRRRGSRAAPGPEVAYLLYTSGSTGRPKGVVQSRANLQGHAQAYARSLALGAGDKLAVVAHHATDAAVMDLFGGLCAGASLHFVDLRRRGVEALTQAVQEQQLTVLHCTPTVLRAWGRAEPAPRRLTSLRALVLGGEPAYAQDARLCQKLLPPQALLINGLGPSECTLALQARWVLGQLEDPPERLPVGEPLPGTQVSLWGEPGATQGELVLHSPHLALGYWRRPQEEARAFLAPAPGASLRRYRTGDRVQRGAQGWVVLGRMDRRLKVRGVQVCLEEVEQHLERLPGVARAVVEALPPRESPRLVAWLTARRGAALAVAPLQGQLSAWLRPEQRPSLQILEALPLTTSGKVDRQALRRLGLPQDSEPGQTEPERWLIRHWGELLPAGPVGRGSHFLALGGDSLRALELVERARRAGWALPLEALFGGEALHRVALQMECLPQAPRPPALLPSGRLRPEETSVLLAQLVHPTSDAWHVPALQHLPHSPPPARLREALERVYREHPALHRRLHRDPRSGWRWAPHQGAPGWHEQRFEGPRAMHQALAQARQLAAAPFSLERGPLLRAAWLGLPGQGALLLLVAHHLLVDGAAMGHLIDLWDAALTGAAPPVLEASPRADLRMESPGEAPQASGFALPAPPQRRQGGGSQRVLWLPGPCTGGLKRLARSQGVTLGMVALAALAVVLRRVHRDPVRAGLVVSTRASPALGTWVNTLPLTLEPPASGSCAAWLGQVKRLVLEALPRRHVPAEQQGPPPQVSLVVHQRPRPALRGGQALPLEPQEAPGALICSVRDLGDHLELGLAWRPEALATHLAEHLTAHWVEVLHRWSQEGDAPMEACAQLPGASRRWLWRQQGAARPDFDLHTSLARRILAQARRTPGRCAALTLEGRLSYGELAQGALGLRDWLARRGAGPGALIPVLSWRHLELPAALLGILSTGAGFVTLDPRWSDEKLKGTLRRLEAGALVAPPELHARARGWGVALAWPAAGGADLEEEALEEMAWDNQRPVYAMFTSGTTGEPKLAMVRAVGLANRLCDMDTRMSPPCPVTLQTTFHAYDTAVWQLLWPLTRGGQVMIPPPEALLDARLLVECIQRARVTVLDLVPSVLRALGPALERLPPQESLAHIILGGEACLPQDMALLRHLSPKARLHNIYGPTEATIGCIAHQVRPQEPAPVPIGRPLAHVQAVVLDQAGALAPPGVPGALHLGGLCLGAGYYDDPEASRRAFVERSVWGEAPTLLYDTGDLAVHREDGALLFLGRRDSQIKVRGHRVELRGVEAALLRHPAIHSAAVLLDEQAQHLVAFVTPAPLPEDRDAFAATWLEPAARPARWFALESLPLAPSGKRDLKALRREMEQRPVSAAEPSARLSPMEQLVARAWQQVLGVTPGSPQDSFVSLGGHSLLLLEVHRLLEAALGRAFPVALLLRAPDLGALAQLLASPEGPPGPDAPRGRVWRRRR